MVQLFKLNNVLLILRRRRRFLLLGLALCTMCALCACGNEGKDNKGTYGHDGYMGYSNSNPNLPNGRQFMDYRSDSKMVKQVLDPIPGIRDTQIYMNGTKLHVNLKVDRDLSDEQVEQLRRKAQSVVAYNMLRYEVHVETHK
ncbi:hypothetical protein ACFO9Q_19520 [Paenibacillus sp. GCM10023252]|uniref:hypothetical protein n=1 Tax=Paenibacillus sp. GCM10023252 TaxID=3252649 RepID=UPI0036190040